MKKIFLKVLVGVLAAILLGLFIYTPLAVSYKKGYENGVNKGIKMMEDSCQLMLRLQGTRETKSNDVFITDWAYPVDDKQWQSSFGFGCGWLSEEITVQEDWQPY